VPELVRVAYIWEKPMEACLHKAFGKYKLKALNKPLMLNHFLYTLYKLSCSFQQETQAVG
jgi:hypothetical protein